MPEDRVAAIRYAFSQTLADKQFLDEANVAKMEINPVTGQEIQEIVGEVFRTPPDLVKRLDELTRE